MMGPDRVPTISFVVADRDSGEIVKAIDPHHVAVRLGDFHAKRLSEYRGLDAGNGVVRVSMTHYNSPAEVNRLLSALDAVLAP